MYAGPEKYGEHGNGSPRKVGPYQEAKAHLTALSIKTQKHIKNGSMNNEPNKGIKRYKVDFSKKKRY